MGLEIPKSANSNQPGQRPLPDVDPQWLLMAAAHMQSIGKFDPFTGSAYNAESKFSDAELSKNTENRQNWGEKEKLDAEMDIMFASQKRDQMKQGTTTSDTGLEDRSMTATVRGSTRTTTPR